MKNNGLRCLSIQVNQRRENFKNKNNHKAIDYQRKTKKRHQKIQIDGKMNQVRKNLNCHKDNINTKCRVSRRKKWTKSKKYEKREIKH